MNFTLMAVLLGVYTIAFPVLVRLACLAHKRQFIDKKAANARRGSRVNLPKPWWPTVRERVSFAMRDTRPSQVKTGKDKVLSGPPNRIILLVLWALGAVAFTMSTVNPMLAVAGFVMFLVTLMWGMITPAKLLATRKASMAKMYEIGKAKLGLPGGDEDNPGAHIQVLEWGDLIYPRKVRYFIPVTFNPDSQEGFLRQFNHVFGKETAWVASDEPDPENEGNFIPGWNLPDGVVTIHSVPPLPARANWHERYVLDPGIAWSFFPIALGVENGVEMPNPDTGETEYVLGFDVSGLQKDVGEKAGYKVANTIAGASPMCYVGGSTGGGKALASKTFVRRVVDITGLDNPPHQ